MSPTGSCVFCSIVVGEATAHEVLRTAEVVAFLDVRPVFPGHVLVVPAVHRDTLLDVGPNEMPVLFAAVQRVAAAVVSALDCDGTFVAMNNTVSQSVPHLHVHVVPRRFKDGLRGFFWPRQRYESDEAMARVAERIRERLMDADT